MTTNKISALTDLGAAPASTDLVPIVDVSDPTQSASGSTKKNLVSDFFLWLLATVRTFTAAPVFETGAAGAAPAIFRQTGGTPGTDEGQISNNGSRTLLADKSGTLDFQVPSGGTYRFLNPDAPTTERVSLAITSNSLLTANGGWQFDATGRHAFSIGGTWKHYLTAVLHEVAAAVNICWSSTANGDGTPDIGLNRAGAGVLRVNDGSTGGGVIEFGQVTDVPTPASNSANIGAEDVAGTAEIICADEGGTETQQTEHRSDGPAWLYDDVAVTGMLDRIEYDRQRYLGGHRYKNVSRRDRKQSGLNETTKRVLLAIVDQLGIVLPAEDLAVLREPSLEQTCEFSETFAQWHARCPEKSAIQKRDWDTDQAAKQAKYDADRQAEMNRVAKLQADHAKELSDYAKMPAAEKAKRPAPVAPELPAVRPAKDIKKPKPSWIK